MNDTDIIRCYLRVSATLNENGLKIDVARNFVIKNLSNPVLAQDVKITEFETIQEVSAWISGMGIGRFYESNKVFDVPNVKVRG